MPDIPETGWRPPTEYPNLAAARCLAIDTETKDPNLLTKGPGWGRHDGHIVGVSVATDDGHSWYFPMRHEVCPEDNLDPIHTLAWLRDALGNARQPKVGANLLYDVGWLQEEGVHVRGDLVDVQFAEALLDERASVGLDLLGQKYLGLGKESSYLYQWCADYYGGQPNDRQRANIFRSPPSLVGPYAQSDVTIPLAVARKQYPLLDQQNLLQLFSMENRLIPLLVAMRMRGVAVDLAKAEKLGDDLSVVIERKQAELNALAGQDVNVNAPASLAAAFDAMGLAYPRTPKGNPSFVKEWLEAQTHPVARLIVDIRKCIKLGGTFVKSYLLEKNVDSRVHCQFHPLRGDKKGTRSGRFSSSDPNLQNIPARDEELAPLIRGLFVPDYGHRGWRRYDYSQIEYRFLAHYAVGKGSEDIRQRYLRDPNTDYHEATITLIHELTRVILGRKPAKNINFGLIYGMGKPKLVKSLGLSKAEGKELFDAYHVGVPFAKATADATAAEAAELGFITTILGRRSRFDLWEPKGRRNDGKPALPLDRAIHEYGDIKRAFTHKALNRRLQGSSADMMKVSMLQCWEDGVFDATGVPLLTVHDELDFSDPGTPESDAGFAEVKRIMECCMPLRVPVVADEEFGPDWGHVK